MVAYYDRADSYLPSSRAIAIPFVLEVGNVLDHPVVYLWKSQPFFRTRQNCLNWKYSNWFPAKPAIWFYLSDQIRVGKVSPGIPPWRTFLGDSVAALRSSVQTVVDHVLRAEAVDTVRGGGTLVEGGSLGTRGKLTKMIIFIWHSFDKVSPGMDTILQSTLGPGLVLVVLWADPLSVVRRRGVRREEGPLPRRLDVHPHLLLEVLQPGDGVLRVGLTVVTVLPVKMSLVLVPSSQVSLVHWQFLQFQSTVIVRPGG